MLTITISACGLRTLISLVAAAGSKMFRKMSVKNELLGLWSDEHRQQRPP